VHQTKGQVVCVLTLLTVAAIPLALGFLLLAAAVEERTFVRR
jgi:hypothetical protein